MPETHPISYNPTIGWKTEPHVLVYENVHAAAERIAKLLIANATVIAYRVQGDTIVLWQQDETA